MTSLDSVHGLLHDPKHATARRSVEVVFVLILLTGSWIATGFFIGIKVRDDRIESMQRQHQRELDDQAAKYRAQLDDLKLTCTRKEVTK